MPPRRYSTKIAQSIFVEHLNRTICLSMGKAKFFYLEFISAKFSYSNERVSIAAVGVEHQNRAIDIRGALKSYDFPKHV